MVEIPPKKLVNRTKQRGLGGVNEPAKTCDDIQSRMLPCPALALCEA